MRKSFKQSYEHSFVVIWSIYAKLWSYTGLDRCQTHDDIFYNSSWAYEVSKWLTASQASFIKAFFFGFSKKHSTNLPHAKIDTHKYSN